MPGKTNTAKNTPTAASSGTTPAQGQGKGQGTEWQALEDQIAATRQELGETVEELAAKADVPSRVKDKAAQLREQATGAPATLTRTARDKAPQIREQVTGTAAKAGQVIPEPARRTAVRATGQTAQAARERPGVLYAATGACTAAGLWLWRRGSS
ncbi:DUF3618 domain-containing protein [Actinoallomurus acanthiterrae]